MQITPSRRISFHPPTEHYCEELASIDGQICELLAKRKELSGNNPGFPNLERILAWSQQYELNEDWLQRIFSFMYREYQRPIISEPASFLRFVPILKLLEDNNIIYSLTYMKQYSNASVVYIEAELNDSDPNVRFGHAYFELFISDKYQCRPDGGCGQRRGMQHSFVVVPPLPDDLTGIEFHLSVKPFRPDLEMQEIFLEEKTVTIK